MGNGCIKERICAFGVKQQLKEFLENQSTCSTDVDNFDDFETSDDISPTDNCTYDNYHSLNCYKQNTVVPFLDLVKQKSDKKRVSRRKSVQDNGEITENKKKRVIYVEKDHLEIKPINELVKTEDEDLPKDWDVPNVHELLEVQNECSGLNCKPVSR